MRSVRMNERRNQEVRRARCNDGAALAFYSAHGFTLAWRTDGRANEEHMPDGLMIWEQDGT